MPQAPDVQQETPAGEAEAEQEKQAETRSVIDRVADLSEDAMRRLAAEIDRNPRLHDALDRLERIEKSVLDRLNIASLDEVAELRKEIASLEKRLTKAETAARRDKA